MILSKLSSLLALALLLPALASAQLEKKQTIVEPQSLPIDLGKITSGDFDGDGDIDQIHSGFCILYENGIATDSIYWDSSYFINNATTADLDGDGDLDFLSASSSTIYAYYNDGHANFSIETCALVSAKIISIEDFDGDGDLDLLCQEQNFASNSLQYLFCENNMDGQAWTVSPLHEPINGLNPLQQPQYGDYNSDGIGDVLFVNNEHVYSLTMTQQPSMELQLVQDMEHNYQDLKSLDANGDGLEDIFLLKSNCDAELSLQSPDGSFVPTSLPASEHCAVLAILDLNGDGYDDLLTRSSTATTETQFEANWFLSTGPASYQQITIPDFPELSSLFVSDYDNDGIDDLQILSQAGFELDLHQAEGSNLQISTLYSDKITFDPRIESIDLNQDGREDILILAALRDEISVSWQREDGIFDAPEVWYSSEFSLYHMISIVDLNNDGQYEVLICHSEGFENRILALHSSPSGDFESATSIAVFNNVPVFECKDIDMDGWIDMVVHHSTDFDISVLFNDGFGNPDAPQFYALQDVAADSQCEDRIFVDYDLDGDLDYIFVEREGTQRRIRFIPYQQGYQIETVETIATIEDVPELRRFSLHHEMINQNPNKQRLMLSSIWSIHLFERLDNESLQLEYDLEFDEAKRQITQPLIDFDLDGNSDIVFRDGIYYPALDYFFQPHDIEESLFAVHLLQPDPTVLPELVASTSDSGLFLYHQGFPALAGTTLIKDQDSSISISPNPATQFIQLGELSIEDKSIYLIHNSRGELIFQGPSGSVDISSWATGLYHVSCINCPQQSNSFFKTR